MKAADQFHVGVVVDDFESALDRLAAQLGLDWCEELRVPTPMRLPSGDTTLTLRFTYSRSVPRLELIEQVPDTLWMPVRGSGLHHLGFWSDDVAADCHVLKGQGLDLEVSGLDPTGGVQWAYLRQPGGPRIELVTRAAHAMLEQWWSTGRNPFGELASP